LKDLLHRAHRILTLPLILDHSLSAYRDQNYFDIA
jgi:hypothetical protein